MICYTLRKVWGETFHCWCYTLDKIIYQVMGRGLCKPFLIDCFVFTKYWAIKLQKVKVYQNLVILINILERNRTFYFHPTWNLITITKCWRLWWVYKCQKRILFIRGWYCTRKSIWSYTCFMPTPFTSFCPVTSANVGISPSNFLTFSFNFFVIL